MRCANSPLRPCGCRCAYPWRYRRYRARLYDTRCHRTGVYSFRFHRSTGPYRTNWSWWRCEWAHWPYRSNRACGDSRRCYRSHRPYFYDPWIYRTHRGYRHERSHRPDWAKFYNPRRYRPGFYSSWVYRCNRCDRSRFYDTWLDRRYRSHRPYFYDPRSYRPHLYDPRTHRGHRPERRANGCYWPHR